MPTMMRLQRHGKKRNPFYHIVIADGRAPRDGRFIEKIGTYNPIPNPAEINLKFDKALDWLQKGAQPTDTVRNILTFKGVIYKHHLLKGVRKGAMTEVEAEAKFQTWLNEKEAKIDAKLKGIEEKARSTKKELLEAETKVKEAREEDLAKKRKEIEDAKVKAAKDAAAAIAAENGEETETPEVVEETPEVVEEPKATEEVKETPAVVEEPKAAEVVKETPEVVEEPKAAEAVKETPEVVEEPKATEAVEETPEVVEEPKAAEAVEETPEVVEEPKATKEESKEEKSDEETKK